VKIDEEKVEEDVIFQNLKYLLSICQVWEASAMEKTHLSSHLCHVFLLEVVLKWF
jgi:hypothetical protein